jgi:hypothetical protein
MRLVFRSSCGVRGSPPCAISYVMDEVLEIFDAQEILGQQSPMSG